MEYICTWIYLDSPEESSEYPQVGKRSHLADFQKVYWRCVAVFFALSTQFNPQRRHVLFSNQRPEAFPDLDGFDLKEFLKKKNVEIVTIPLTWQTPEGYFGKWRNQFYIFDILKFIETQWSDGSGSQWSDDSRPRWSDGSGSRWSDDSKSSDHYAVNSSDDLESSDECAVAGGSDSSDDLASSDEDKYIILDSDCIINRPLDALFAEIGRYGLMALPMPYSDTHNINGVTRQDMKRIFAELDRIGGHPPASPGKGAAENPVYYGGEIFAATLPVIRQINALAPLVWQDMLERHRAGQPKLNEEAHFLSYCYHRIGNFGSLEGFIKRIWTSPHYSNVQPEDVKLPIWHLPSEKTGGIALIFKKLEIGPETSGWKVEQLAGYVGVPKRKKYLNWRHFLKYTWLYRQLKKT